MLCDFALHHRDLVRLRDYICTARNRVLSLGLWKNDAQTMRMLDCIQARTSIFANKEEPNKAPPASIRHLRPLSQRQLLQFKIACATAMRVSSCLTLNLSGVDPRIGKPAQFLKSSTNKNKTDSFVTWIPMSLAVAVRSYETLNPWSRVFPMTEMDMALLCDSMGYGTRSHSFRRAFAVALRLKADELGMRTKKSIKGTTVHVKINRLAGWTTDTFFEYSKDYELHRSTPMFMATEVLEYVFAAFLRGRKELMVGNSTQFRGASG